MKKGDKGKIILVIIIILIILGFGIYFLAKDVLLSPGSMITRSVSLITKEVTLNFAPGEQIVFGLTISEMIPAGSAELVSDTIKENCDGADVNGDGNVDSDDLSIVRSNFETYDATILAKVRSSFGQSCFSEVFFRRDIIDADELAEVRAKFGSDCTQVDCGSADWNYDNKVDSLDLSYVETNFGARIFTWVIINPDGNGVPRPISAFIGKYKLSKNAKISGQYLANEIDEIVRGVIV